MAICPLATHPTPRYPTRLEVQGTPQLLEDAVPESGIRNEMLAVASAVAVATSAGCATGSQSVAGPKPLPQHAIVAPIFEHGEGRASSGCVVVSPPVFLSEEEALSIIKREAAKKGLHFADNYRHPLAGVSHSTAVGRSPFIPNLYDPEHAVAVEFVSSEAEELVYSWDSGARRMESSVQVYGFKQASQALAEKVRAHASEGVYFGVFYDPAGNAGDTQSAQKQNAELLRQQVADFLDWLASQGAL